MIRSLFVPAILIGLIAIPFLIPVESPGPRDPVAVDSELGSGNSNAPFQLASSQRTVDLGLSPALSGPMAQPGSGATVVTQNSPLGYPIQTQNGLRTPVMNPAINQFAGSAPGVTGTQGFQSRPMVSGNASPIYDERGNIIGLVGGSNGGLGVDAPIAGMTPDLGAIETFYLPGNASGPDLQAAPLEFVPVFNFEEIFRYDVQPGWVRGRWDRVSTTPSDQGLQGYRVALVTGTQSWDLHGSLTYFFDQDKRCQRITFRGWAGDARRLIDFLEKRHAFKSQPTNHAGYYLAKSGRVFKGGLLMRHPAVLYAENKVQQVAVLLELNAPKSGRGLSDDFVSLIQGSFSSN